MDVDRPADAAFLDIRLRALVHLDPADDLGGQGQIVEAAGRIELVEDEPVGGRDCVAVDQRLGQVGRGAAQRHALALAELAIDDDAGYALKRLGDILVRKFAAIFRADDVGVYIRIALGLDRLAERTATAGYDDFGIGRVGRWRLQNRNRHVREKG